jgi:TubC N-terminal docking domain
VTAADLLADLARQGFTLAPEGEDLRVRPASRLAEDLREAVRQHKAELLALLRGREDGVLVRVLERDQGLPAGALRLWDARPRRCGGCHFCH